MSIPQIDASRSEVVSTRVHHLQFINARLSQRALALRLGSPAASLSNKITGRTAWNLDELYVLCEVFDVSADYLLGRTPIDSAKPNPSLVGRTGLEPVTDGL